MYKSGLMELEAAVAIARLGSFRAAAVDLDVSPTSPIPSFRARQEPAEEPTADQHFREPLHQRQ